MARVARGGGGGGMFGRCVCTSGLAWTGATGLIYKWLSSLLFVHDCICCFRRQNSP